MVKPLWNGRRRGKWLERAAKSAALWRQELIVDPVKLTKPVWKNSTTLVHVFSAAGAPLSLLPQPSSPHSLNFSGNHLIAEALVCMRYTQLTEIEAGHSSGSGVFRPTHLFLLWFAYCAFVLAVHFTC